MALDLSEYPRFTLAERDRRWGRVRELMREANCDQTVAVGLTHQLAHAPPPAVSLGQREARVLGKIQRHGFLRLPIEVGATVSSVREFGNTRYALLFVTSPYTSTRSNASSRAL